MNKDIKKMKGRRRIMVFGFLTASMAILVGCVFTVKNPWMPKTVDAGRGDVTLEEVYERRNPYVTITNIDLEFTGFYTVDGEDGIESYCFIGDVGGVSAFVELSADTAESLTDDVKKGIKNCTVKGELVPEADLIKVAAEDESMSSEEYREYYGISEIMVDEAHNGIEVCRIIYGIIFLAIIAGTILIAIFTCRKCEHKEN